MSKYGHRPHNWFEAIVNKLGGEENAERFLPNELIVAEQARLSNILPIDRSTPFNPENFIGKGWKIEEEDDRSLNITELDLSKIELVLVLREGQISVSGEEKLKGLRACGKIRLDAKILQALWEHKELIPAHWKEKIQGYKTNIFFDGTELRSPRGRSCVLCLYFVQGEWNWRFRWLDYGWGVGDPSAVLAQVSPKN